MRHRLRQLLLLVLVLCLMPGWVELIENIEHLAHDGHLAHGASQHEGEDEAHAALEAEHGCTPVNHTCGCHVSIPVVLPGEVELAHATPVVVLRDRPLGLDTHGLHRANAPPTPPPRA